MDSKIIVREDYKEPVTSKFTVLLKKSLLCICSGCLISSRHILSTGTCMDRLREPRENITDILWAYIGQHYYRITHIVYHPDYIPGKKCRLRYQDFGMALVYLLFIVFHFVIYSFKD